MYRGESTGMFERRHEPKSKNIKKSSRGRRSLLMSASFCEEVEDFRRETSGANNDCQRSKPNKMRSTFLPQNFLRGVSIVKGNCFAGGRMFQTIFVRIALSLLLLGSVAGLTFTGKSTAVAQSPASGTWTADVREKDPNKIQLNFSRRNESGRRHSMGQTYNFSDLQGLSREQALSGGPVRFSLVREAGRIDCEGTFQYGTGS